MIITLNVPKIGSTVGDHRESVANPQLSRSKTDLVLGLFLIKMQMKQQAMLDHVTSAYTIASSACTNFTKVQWFYR